MLHIELINHKENHSEVTTKENSPKHRMLVEILIAWNGNVVFQAVSGKCAHALKSAAGFYCFCLNKNGMILCLDNDHYLLNEFHKLRRKKPGILCSLKSEYEQWEYRYRDIFTKYWSKKTSTFENIRKGGIVGL